MKSRQGLFAIAKNLFTFGNLLVTLLVTVWFPLIVNNVMLFFEPSPILPVEKYWACCGVASNRLAKLRVTFGLVARLFQSTFACCAPQAW